MKAHFARKKRRTWLTVFMLAALLILIHEVRFWIPHHIRPGQGMVLKKVELKTTSYCHCSHCCSYNWLLFIPWQRNPSGGVRIKHIGKTSSGSFVRPGCIAADTALFPYGTIMYIPGYGYGRVEDTGGAVKGMHIDLYRPSHWWARFWGSKNKTVKVWLMPQPEEKESDP
ncbi:MAG TPA: 3D domain-containing protein [Pontiella sp.]